MSELWDEAHARKDHILELNEQANRIRAVIWRKQKDLKKLETKLAIERADLDDLLNRIENEE